jgi:hypothetical protein
VPFYHLHTLAAGIPSVAIQDKGNVARNWSCAEDAKKDTLDVIDTFVPKPVRVLQKYDSPLVRDDGSFSPFVVCAVHDEGTNEGPLQPVVLLVSITHPAHLSVLNGEHCRGFPE